VAELFEDDATDEDEGRFGSKPWSGTGFQRRNLSLTAPACASFVGVIAGDLIPDGDMVSNIPERSRTSLPCVLGFTDVDDSSTNSTSVFISIVLRPARGWCAG